MKTLKCKKKQCQYNHRRVLELENQGNDFRKQIAGLLNQIKAKEVNVQLGFKVLEAKQLLLRSIGQLNEAAARIIEP